MLAAEFLASQSWADIEDLVKIVSIEIDTSKSDVFCLTVKHISKDDRQHLVRLLAEYIKTYPRDQWAYSWVPSQKLISKAIAMAKGSAPEEVANSEGNLDFLDPDSD